MRGWEATNELEVIEYVENEHVRIVADTHGTVWDTIFTVRLEAGGTRLEMVMDARPRELLPKLINLLMKGLIQKEIEKEFGAVKEYCEEYAGRR